MSLKGLGSNLAAIGAAVLTTICLPLIVAYAGVSHALLIRRLARTPCPRCGAPFGRAAVASARQRWREELQRIRSQSPGVRLRIIAEWELVCPSCRSSYFVSPSSASPAALRPKTSEPPGAHPASSGSRPDR